MHATSKSNCCTQIDPNTNMSSNPFTNTTYLLPFALTYLEMNKRIGETGPTRDTHYLHGFLTTGKSGGYALITSPSVTLGENYKNIFTILKTVNKVSKSKKCQTLQKEFASSFANTRTPRVNAFQYSQKAFIFSVPLIKQHCY